VRQRSRRTGIPIVWATLKLVAYGCGGSLADTASLGLQGTVGIYKVTLEPEATDCMGSATWEFDFFAISRSLVARPKAREHGVWDCQ
jgi:hypothetical protein